MCDHIRLAPEHHHDRWRRAPATSAAAHHRLRMPVETAPGRPARARLLALAGFILFSATIWSIPEVSPAAEASGHQPAPDLPVSDVEPQAIRVLALDGLLCEPVNGLPALPAHPTEKWKLSQAVCRLFAQVFARVF
jgi:hypothetical protein